MHRLRPHRYTRLRSYDKSESTALSPSASGEVEPTIDLMRRARDSIAYGRFDGLLERPLLSPEGLVSPFFAVGAEGCRVTDASGRSYVDWVNAFGPVILGYRHPEVERAIVDQLQAGPILPLMHPIEVEVAETLVQMIPCAEKVAFGKNGSDVLNAAVRVVRAATGRDLILQHGFHGYHEWYMCTQPGVRGIPNALRTLVEPFPYNDIEALRGLFERFPDQVAAVVMEPVNTRMPEPGFLQRLIDLAHSNGALVVFDELVTGFRLANGGAQEHFGVTPDIGCFGKAIANGMPLAAIAGKRELMEVLPSVGYGMTYRGETLSLAAASATLGVLNNQPVCRRLRDVGAHVRARYSDTCDRFGVRSRLVGPDARLTFAFEDEGGFSWDGLVLLFVKECVKRGVLTNGNLLPSYAIDDEAIEMSLQVFEEAMEVVAGVIDHGPRRTGERLARRPPGVPAVKGSIDRLQHSAGRVHVVGWLLVDDEPPQELEIVSRLGERVACEPMNRPDLAVAFPEVERAEEAGFVGDCPAAMLADEDGLTFTVEVRRDDQVVSRCLVVSRLGMSSIAIGSGPVADGFVSI